MKQRFNLKPLLEFDYFLFAGTLALLFIGIIFIYSSGVYSNGSIYSNEFQKQIIWSSIGIIIMLAIALLDYERIKSYSFWIYALFLFLLVYVRLFGREVNGAHAWLGVGELGIEPSEFAKIATILFLAKYLENTKQGVEPFKRFVISFAIILIPVILILSQPDMGTALVYFPIFIFMAFVAGLKKRYIFFVLFAALITIVLVVLPYLMEYILKTNSLFLSIFVEFKYCIILIICLSVCTALAFWGNRKFKKKYFFWIFWIGLLFTVSLVLSQLAHLVIMDYQVKRLIIFLDPNIDLKNFGWNINQSITAIGSGGFSGKGLLQGTQSHSGYVPEHSTDFIFSLICEEWGFLGGLLIYALFFLIIARGIYIMKTAKDSYAVSMCAGIIGMIFFHLIVNTGMTMSIMPITGIPLMFISYGGASLWTGMIGVGLLMSAYIRRYRS